MNKFTHIYYNLSCKYIGVFYPNINPIFLFDEEISNIYMKINGKGIRCINYNNSSPL